MCEKPSESASIQDQEKNGSKNLVPTEEQQGQSINDATETTIQPLPGDSVKAPSDREEVKSALQAMGVAFIEKDGTTQLQKSLQFHLRKNHPLHQHLKKLKVKQLKSIYSLLCPDEEPVTKDFGRKLRFRLAEHCFNTFPESPLGYLQQKLKEESMAKDATTPEESKHAPMQDLYPTKAQESNVVPMEIANDDATVQKEKPMIVGNPPKKPKLEVQRPVSYQSKKDIFPRLTMASDPEFRKYVETYGNKDKWWPPPEDTTLEKTFKRMTLDEVHAKDYIYYLFDPLNEDWHEIDTSTKVAKSLSKSEVLDKYLFWGYEWSDDWTSSKLKKNLEALLRRDHPLHDFIDQKMNNDLQTKVYRYLKGDLPDYLQGRPSLLKEKLAEACFDKNPESPLAMMYHSLEMVAINTVNAMKKDPEKPGVENWSVVIAENTSLEELSNACRNLHLVVPQNADSNLLKQKLELFLKEKHPIRAYIKGKERSHAEEFFDMAYYLALKKKLTYNQIKTFKLQAKVIADFCIEDNPESPFDAMYDLWVDTKALMEKRKFDYPLTPQTATKEEIMEKLAKMRVPFDPEESKESLFEALNYQEAYEHPVSSSMAKLKRHELERMCQSLAVKRRYRMNADQLRTELGAQIFQRSPQAPYHLFNQIYTAAKRPRDIAEAWRGIPLVNSHNTCYLTAAVNGILSIRKIRDTIGEPVAEQDEAEPDVFTQGEKNILQSNESNVLFEKFSFYIFRFEKNQG